MSLVGLVWLGLVGWLDRDSQTCASPNHVCCLIMNSHSLSVFGLVQYIVQDLAHYSLDGEFAASRRGQEVCR